MGDQKSGILQEGVEKRGHHKKRGGSLLLNLEGKITVVPSLSSNVANFKEGRRRELGQERRCSTGQAKKNRKEGAKGV